MRAISSHKLGHHLFQTFDQKPQWEEELYEVKQVHSSEITIFNDSDLSSVESDGICYMYNQSSASKPSTIHLAIKTADCLSIAIVGNKGAINLHAGWRGLTKEILFHPLVKSCEPYSFLLSAAISEEHYEVGQEFTDLFCNYSEGLLKDSKNGKLTFSLHKTAAQMIKSHYPKAKIFRDELDTFSHPELNSFRRDRTAKRNWNILSLNPEYFSA